jgi:hypothetical protein
MAKPKIDFQKILLEKGEKIGAVAAVGVMGLLIVLGVWTMIDSADTGEEAKKLSDPAAKIQGTIAKDTQQKPKDLAKEILEPVVFDTVVARNYDNPPQFIDIVLDNQKRASPNILAPVEFQVDLARVPIRTYNYQGDKNSEIAVIYTKDIQPKDRIKKLDERGKKDKKTDDKKQPAAPAPAGPAGATGAFPGAMPGGAPGALGPGGMAMGPGGATGPGGAGAAPATATSKTETGVAWVDIKKITQNQKLAEFIQPVRMVVVSASFPYRKQLEEFQKALRYQSMPELLASPSDMPVFKGFNVQRQIRHMDGRIALPWTDFEWQIPYRTQVYKKKVLENEPEDPRIEGLPVIPPDNQQLYLPMPKLAPGRHYPPLALNTILDTADKMKKAGTSPASSSWVRGSGEGDIFDHSGAGEAEKEKDKEKKDATDMNTGGANEPPDYCLVRFLDVTVKVGYIYEYRIQMKCKNPNKGKDKLVGRPDYAKVDELVGPWVDVRFQKDGNLMSGIPIPFETEVYAAPSEHKGNLPPDQVRLQVQSWLEYIRPQKDNAGYTEQVGDWVVADLEASRGQVIQGSKNVKLPLWSAIVGSSGGYQFKELGKVKAPASQKGTVTLDFPACGTLVDFEGGKTTHRYRYHDKTFDITDDSGIEILIVNYEGRLMARTNAVDEKNATRRDREQVWNTWQKDTEAANEKAPDAGTPNPFGTPGGNKPK